VEFAGHESDGSSTVRVFLSSVTVFSSLGQLELAEIEGRSKVIVLQSGQSLFKRDDQGQSLYVVVSGVLEFVGGPQSKSLPDRLGTGSVFVRAALGLYMPGSMSAVAKEDSRVISIPISLLEVLLRDKPAIRAAIASQAARHLLRMHLSATHMFSDLDDAVFSSVADSSEFVMVKRGETLIWEGDKPDCLYIVAFGSLEVFRQRADGTMHTIDILRDGACVGEMAVLLNEPRSVSVRAWRDSLLVKVSAECFERVLRSNAHVTLELARTLGARLKRMTTSSIRAVPVKTVSLFPFTAAPYFTVFCEGLRAAFEESGKSVAFLTASTFTAVSGGSSSLDTMDDCFYAWLADQEATHDYVLCQCDRTNPGWTDRCNRQADLALFVCMPERDAPGEDMKRQVETCKASGDAVEIVLLHSSAAAPEGTAKWLDVASFKSHHHVFLGDKQSCARVARRLSGQAWGLVLGGGGARGLSHIGTIQALRENGMPIDWIGGTSMGAIIAAQAAMGLNAEEMLRVTKIAYGGSARSRDFTFPFVAMRTGQSTIQTLRDIFGERRIEDLPTNYFCVSCNLTRADIVVHERGPVWMWARVSCSVPGLLPPVPHQGDLLVDGGLLQNLPVEIMRQRCGGYVAASDVSVAADLAVNSELTSEDGFSGFSHLMQKLRKRPTLPDIFRVLMRTAEVSSVRDSRVSGSPADLYLHPPLDSIGMTDFHAIDRIVAIGYEYALRSSKDWKTRQKTDSLPSLP
jgi:predicted acylesterase/phospholipase RssA/CRP-like cAMP-binding protein